MCGVDWSPLANVNYLQAALKSTHTTAYWLSRFIITLNQAGISYANVSIAGHSLGGQIAGFTGKNVRLFANGLLGTIYGLDPAGPLFTFPVMAPPQNILQSTDAAYVQVLHTSAFTLGVALGSSTGDAFFSANGGVYQPGCVVETVVTGNTSECPTWVGVGDVDSMSVSIELKTVRLATERIMWYRTIYRDGSYRACVCLLFLHFHKTDVDAMIVS